MTKLILLTTTVIFVVGAIVLKSFIFQSRLQLPYQQTYQFKDAKMSYRFLGKGKPIVLVHGALTNDPWKGFEEKLAESYTVYLPDLPGFGASDAVKGQLHNIDLFSEALCVFFKKTKLHSASVIAFSQGTLVAVKTAAKRCISGKLILVGMPGKISGWKFELVRWIPVALRRIIVATKFGKENLLLPILRENLGEADKDIDKDFLKEIVTTDPRSLADIDVQREIEKDLPKYLPQAQSETIFIYGEWDRLQETTKHIIDEYITVLESDHVIFQSQPEKTLEILNQLI